MSSRPHAATAVAATLILIAASSLTGCGHVEEHVDAAHDTVADAAHGAQDAAEGAAKAALAALTPEAREAAIGKVLAAADALDGTTDHVVAKCPGCKLAMDGSADHAKQVGEYELHFCSASCSEHFNADTDSSLIALETVLGAI